MFVTDSFSALKSSLTLCRLCNFHAFLVVFWGTFSKNSFRNPISVSTVWIQIRTDFLPVLIWLKTICKYVASKLFTLHKIDWMLTRTGADEKKAENCQKTESVSKLLDIPDNIGAVQALCIVSVY